MGVDLQRKKLLKSNVYSFLKLCFYNIHIHIYFKIIIVKNLIHVNIGLWGLNVYLSSIC